MGHQPLSPTMMVQLAAPHTWSAAIMPVVLGVAYAYAVGAEISVSLALSMLVIAVLMQSAVNTLNDYMDYRKGTDTLDNQLDPTDAVLVYNNVDPAAVLRYFVVLMAVAFVLGLTVVARSSWVTLAIGVVAALVIVLYSVGKTPLSYLPLGEFVSGFTMGGLITLATCYVLIGEFSWVYLLVSLPLILSIGLINMTNNTCDIEKDIEASRKTMSVVLGRKKAVVAYRVYMLVIVLSAIVLTSVLFPGGLMICLLMVLALIPGFKALWNNPLVMKTRGPAMGQVVTLNIVLGAFYSLAIAFGGQVALVL